MSSSFDKRVSKICPFFSWILHFGVWFGLGFSEFFMHSATLVLILLGWTTDAHGLIFFGFSLHPALKGSLHKSVIAVALEFVCLWRYLTERLSLGNVLSSGNHHWIAIKLTKLIMHGFITTLSPNSIYNKVTSAKAESPCHQRVSQQVCAGPVFFTLSHEFWPLSSLLSFIFLVLLSSPCSG